MWLIADSGSTKTEWRLFDAGGIHEKASTRGLNPLFFNKDKFIEVIKKELPSSWFSNVSNVWFYSAGTATPKVKKSTAEWLKSIFTNCEIKVESDLLAAARATCGSDKGIIAILGTGSNSALYNGHAIIEHIKPLGYILGDEGSGVALGKSLLRKLLRNEFSEQLSQSICTDLGLSYEDIIEHVYRSESPNRFIASCTRVLHSHRGEKEIQDLITTELEGFVTLLSKYSLADELSFNFVGSIAHYFDNNLKDIIESKGFKLGKIVQQPADLLVEYHIKNQ